MCLIGCTKSIFVSLLAEWVECSPANGQVDLGSIPGGVIPKTLKWYLMPPCLTLSNIRYVSMVRCSTPGKRIVPSPTPRCCSNWKVSLLVALDYNHQLYFYLYIYIYIYMCVYICWFVGIYIYIYIYIYICWFVGICMSVCTYASIYACMVMLESNT